MEVASLSMSFNAGEHNYRKITVTLEKALNAKSVRLIFVTPLGKRLMSEALETDGATAEFKLPAEVLDGRGTLTVQAVVYNGKSFIAKSSAKKFFVDSSLDCVEYTQSGGVVSPEVLEDRIAEAQSAIDEYESRIAALETAYSDTEALVGDFTSKYEVPSVRTNLYGKKWVALGDIQTMDNSYKDGTYVQYAAEKLGITDTVRCTAHLGGIAKRSANDEDALCVKAKSLTDSADLITVMGGLIDQALETALGNVGDTVETTFYGAMNSLCTTLLTKYPDKTIVFITPTAISSDATASDTALKASDYADAIKKICGKYSIPVYDAHTLAGICPFVTAQRDLYTVGGMYLNTEGHKKIANGLVNFLNTLSSVRTSFSGGQTHAAEQLLLNKNEISLFGGESGTVKAYVLPANADKKTVWSGSNEGLTVSADGDTCTVSGAPGEHVLTCTSGDGTRSASCGVKIKKKGILPESVSVSAPSQYVAVGGTMILTASVLPETAAEEALEWSTDNDCVILVPNGKVCTVIGAAQGRTVVRCSAPSCGISGSAEITSKIIVPVSAVSVEPAASAMAVGQTKEFAAFITPENAENREVNWYITDSTVASITADGAKCTVTGVSTGECTLYCVSINGKKSNEVDISVVESPVSVTGITLDKSVLSVAKYKTATVTATVSPAAASNKKVLWHASNESIEITPSANGSCVVKGLKYGTSKLTATTVDGSFKAVCTVTVPEE